jgi:hypothetical protein
MKFDAEYCNYYLCLAQNNSQNVFCILIPQLLKFWKTKFEAFKPSFLN